MNGDAGADDDEIVGGELGVADAAVLREVETRLPPEGNSLRMVFAGSTHRWRFRGLRLASSTSWLLDYFLVALYVVLMLLFDLWNVRPRIARKSSMWPTV